MGKATWETRELPVLRAVVATYESGDKVVKSTRLAKMTGLEDDEVICAARLLVAGGYLVGDVREPWNGPPFATFALIPTERALQRLGMGEPMPESVWTSRDLIVLAVIAGAWDDGHGFENLDQVADALGFDRDVVARSATVLHDDGLIRGTPSGSHDIVGDDDLLTPRPTGAGYRALDEWPSTGNVAGLVQFAEQRATDAGTPDQRDGWRRVRDALTTMSARGAGAVNVLAAIKTLWGS